VSAPPRVLRARGRRLTLGGAPVLMGIVNASPDSFSDAGELADVAAQVVRARELAAAGARIIDIGGESAFGGRPPVVADEEAARVVPVIDAVASELDVLVAVDTYKPAVADAAIAAGAHIVNDVSGLHDPELAEVCAGTGAALVVMHTRVAPRGTLLDPEFYDDVVADVRQFLSERMAVAEAAGMHPEQLLLDPGPDFAKTPAQTVAVLRRLDVLHALGRPLLLPVSRKDFLGAITGRPPRERDAATLAAVGWAADAGAHAVRVHDVRGAADFLAVRAVLHGERTLDPTEGLTPDRYPPGTLPPSLRRPSG
jgi:dihydropteroate synthase